MHAQRVLWLLEELLPLAQTFYFVNVEKARVQALVHDDAEMITGDYQAGHKARMSAEELAKIAQGEKEAVEQLSKKYPQIINGYNYQELLLHALNKDCIEAQLVSYIDKIDAQCESLHEVLAGNIQLLRSIMFYVNVLTSFPKKFPELSLLLASKESPLTYLTDVAFPQRAETKRYIHLTKLHTKESLMIETDFPFYNTWRKLIIEKGGEEGMGWLINQKEYL